MQVGLTDVSVQKPTKTSAGSRGSQISYGKLGGMYYLTTNAANVRDSPKHRMEEAVPNKPIIKIGFRPMWSEALLHCRTVIDSVRKNRDSWKQSSGWILAAGFAVYYSQSALKLKG
jgi:hypothetical protein